MPSAAYDRAVRPISRSVRASANAITRHACCGACHEQAPSRSMHASTSSGGSDCWGLSGRHSRIAHCAASASSSPAAPPLMRPRLRLRLRRANSGVSPTHPCRYRHTGPGTVMMASASACAAMARVSASIFISAVATSTGSTRRSMPGSRSSGCLAMMAAALGSGTSATAAAAAARPTTLGAGRPPALRRLRGVDAGALAGGGDTSTVNAVLGRSGLDRCGAFAPRPPVPLSLSLSVAV
mmetsp:Transcript_17265/g.60672  ORF Transcript_17265/g.60672 Transcript_17265/m.60672 type:complete len:239 (+) Transcript_17265:1715-2431(+)